MASTTQNSASGLQALFLVLLPLLPVAALAAAPQLSSITPCGAQRGTELEVIFNGDRLQDAEEVVFYEPGLQVLKLSSVTNKTVTAQIKILADCAFGEHHARLRAASGFSELRTFFVGPFPTVSETEPNNEPS